MSQNPWIEHVKRYQKLHPKLTYGECLKRAAPSYHSQTGGASVEKNFVCQMHTMSIDACKMCDPITGDVVPNWATVLPGEWENPPSLGTRKSLCKFCHEHKGNVEC